MIHKVNVLVDLDEKRSFQGVEQASYATLTYLNAPPGDMTLVLTDNATIQKMNKQFMDLDQPTDVLAFPDGDEDLETGRVYFGDVIIAIPFAEDQTRQTGNSLEDELALLSIHGVLHLLGYEHNKTAQERGMKAWEEKVVAKVMEWT